MAVLAWAIPLAVFGATFTIGFLLAPYYIYKPVEKERDELKESLKPRLKITCGNTKDEFDRTKMLTDNKNSYWPVFAKVVKVINESNTEARICRIRIREVEPELDFFYLPRSLLWFSNDQEALDIEPKGSAYAILTMVTIISNTARQADPIWVSVMGDDKPLAITLVAWSENSPASEATIKIEKKDNDRVHPVTTLLGEQSEKDNNEQ